jgi:hypothetical protein
VKQIPIFVLFVLAGVMSASISTLTVSSWPALLAGAVLITLATALAVLFTRLALARFALIVPALDFLAAGALRHGTGESQSIYASLVLLPVLWFASTNGRRYVGYAIAGTVIAILVPFAMGSTIGNNPNELLRRLYSTLIFALAAGVVNELARRARQRLTAAQVQAAVATEELSRAAQIQRFLLPRGAAPLPGYETAGACLPSKAVEGDFFDWYLIEGGLAFTLGDVAGKGAGAGMIAATTRAVIRSAKNSHDPVAALHLTADCFATDLDQASSFATLFHARLRGSTGPLLHLSPRPRRCRQRQSCPNKQLPSMYQQFDSPTGGRFFALIKEGKSFRQSVRVTGIGKETGSGGCVMSTSDSAAKASTTQQPRSNWGSPHAMPRNGTNAS